jgi:hypothetical protein
MSINYRHRGEPKDGRLPATARRIRQIVAECGKRKWPRLLFQQYDEVTSNPGDFPALVRELRATKLGGGVTQLLSVRHLRKGLRMLGLLDLDGFKREVRYCLLPNGVANDRVRQIDGRYNDSADFDFMMRMGVWTENLSLPAVLNECLMQSYTDVIRLFPNTHKLGPARFQNLRAVGAFLVAAACRTLEDEAKSTSIRDLYYMVKHTIEGSTENTFDDQSESDPVIEDPEMEVEGLADQRLVGAAGQGGGPVVPPDGALEIFFLFEQQRDPAGEVEVAGLKSANTHLHLMEALTIT